MEMDRDDAEIDLDATLIAEACFCWRVLQDGNYHVTDFIRDIELFVGGPVHADRIGIAWLEVLGVDGVLTGMTEDALIKLDERIGRDHWNTLSGWNALSHAWSYAVSSRSREFLFEDGSNCWTRITGSSFDFSLWKTAGSLSEEARRDIQPKRKYHRSLSEIFCPNWRERFTLPNEGLAPGGDDDE